MSQAQNEAKQQQQQQQQQTIWLRNKLDYNNEKLNSLACQFNLATR